MVEFRFKALLSSPQSESKRIYEPRRFFTKHFTSRNGSVAEGHSVYPNEIDSRISSDFNIVAHSLIKSEKGITTFRAILNESISVVVKFASGESPAAHLLSQAQYYRHELKELQGSYIPILYGVFTGIVRAPPPERVGANGKQVRKPNLRAEETARFYCMVLEDCGKSLNLSKVFIHDLSTAEKQRIMLIIGQFHILGLVSPRPDSEYDAEDICEEHLLRKDKRFRTIGFHKLEKHECTFTKFRFNIRHQRTKQVGCSDLYLLIDDYGAQEATIGEKVHIMEHEFPNDGLLPQQDIVDALVEPWMAHPINLERLADWLLDLEEWRKAELEKDSIQDLDDIISYAETIKPKFDEIGVLKEV